VLYYAGALAMWSVLDVVVVTLLTCLFRLDTTFDIMSMASISIGIDTHPKAGAAWFCAAVMSAVLIGVVATYHHRQYAHSPPRRGTITGAAAAASEQLLRKPHANWPVPSSDGGWSVCGGAGTFWQTVVPLLLLTGVGAVLSATFSPLVEARYVMPALNTPQARIDLRHKLVFILDSDSTSATKPAVTPAATLADMPAVTPVVQRRRLTQMDFDSGGGDGDGDDHRGGRGRNANDGGNGGGGFRVRFNGEDVVGGSSGTSLGKLGLSLAKIGGFDVGDSHLDENGALHVDRKALAKAGIGFAKKHGFDVGDSHVEENGELLFDTKAIKESALHFAKEQGVDVGHTHVDSSGKLHVDPAAVQRLTSDALKNLNFDGVDFDATAANVDRAGNDQPQSLSLEATATNKWVPRQLRVAKPTNEKAQSAIADSVMHALKSAGVGSTETIAHQPQDGIARRNVASSLSPRGHATLLHNAQLATRTEPASDAPRTPSSMPDVMTRMTQQREARERSASRRLRISALGSGRSGGGGGISGRGGGGGGGIGGLGELGALFGSLLGGGFGGGGSGSGGGGGGMSNMMVNYVKSMSDSQLESMLSAVPQPAVPPRRWTLARISKHLMDTGKTLEVNHLPNSVELYTIHTRTLHTETRTLLHRR
jgi:hypothetical protein